MLHWKALWHPIQCDLQQLKGKPISDLIDMFPVGEVPLIVERGILWFSTSASARVADFTFTVLASPPTILPQWSRHTQAIAPSVDPSRKQPLLFTFKTPCRGLHAKSSKRWYHIMQKSHAKISAYHEANYILAPKYWGSLQIVPPTFELFQFAPLNFRYRMHCILLRHQLGPSFA